MGWRSEGAAESLGESLQARGQRPFENLLKAVNDLPKNAQKAIFHWRQEALRPPPAMLNVRGRTSVNQRGSDLTSHMARKSALETAAVSNASPLSVSD